MVDKLLAWELTVFALRLAVTVALLAASWIGFLYLWRYLRPSNIKEVAGADPPTVAEARLFGQKLVFDTQEIETEALRSSVGELAGMIETVDGRLQEVEEKHRALDNRIDVLEEDLEG